MSKARLCEFFLATDRQWYVRLGDYEYAWEQEECTTYGPFDTEDAAAVRISCFSNPGGSETDDSGTQPPPLDTEP